ncbi:MAG TPA: hypothetical protein PKE66_11575 [Pyrinomonadaceae bacterium]|nr:hypothetical protein [Pyrinomonadaceae bacterium]
MLLAAFSIPAAAQVKVSDVKLQGLKGPVKSVVSTSKAISGYAEWVLNDETKYQTTSRFNRDGELTEKIYVGGLNSQVVFTKVDGFKTFKSFELETPKNETPRVTGSWVSPGKEEPIEPGEKLTAPDERFDYKYVYEISENGRVITEREYGKTGKLFRKRLLKFDEAGRLVDETEEDIVARMTYSYKHDENGNVIEVFKTRDIKLAGSDSKERITYTEMKFDSTGNWTERKVTRYQQTEGLPKYKIPAEKNTFVNFETRTITYY